MHLIPQDGPRPSCRRGVLRHIAATSPPGAAAMCASSASRTARVRCPGTRNFVLLFGGIVHNFARLCGVLLTGVASYQKTWTLRVSTGISKRIYWP
jgi:hypothetical protein